MGVAMAGMLEPRLSPVPGTIWRAVFAAAAAWFAWQAIRAPTGRRAAVRPPGAARRRMRRHGLHAPARRLPPVRPRAAMAMPGMTGGLPPATRH